MTETQQRNYQATFILNTRDYDQPIDALVGSIKEALKELGAEPAEALNLGRQEFVRVTDKKHTGDIYIQIAMSAPKDLPSKVQERFRLDKTVKRILVESV